MHTWSSRGASRVDTSPDRSLLATWLFTSGWLANFFLIDHKNLYADKISKNIRGIFKIGWKIELLADMLDGSTFLLENHTFFR
jgi:hypothetical protein